jgi:hypothetical protein
MNFSLKENIVMLETLLEHVSSHRDLVEAKVSKLTPYQKAQRSRRQTVAAHTPRPAKQSAFYKHAVRAIFQKLRKDGEAFNGSAKGGQLIAQWMMKKYGYASGNPQGGFSLTGKGKARNMKHTREPFGVRKRKEKAYDYIMGIQRRAAAKKQAVVHRSMGAG